MQAAGGYPPPGFFDPRLDLLRQHQHGHPLYPLGVPSHLYAAMMSGGPAAALGHYNERLKFEEEQQRMRVQEEERERSLREKEQREREARELREKEQREREKKERELREKEQREKEAREREIREKEREKEMEAARKEHSRMQAMKFYAAQMYNSPLGRSYQGIPAHVAAAYQMQGVRAPQGLPFSTQGAMGISLGLGVPPNLPPHLAGHPGFTSLAMSHPGLQLPHLSPHYMQPSMSSAHSLSSAQPPHTSTASMNLSTSAPSIVTSSPSLYYGHPHAHMPPSSQPQQQTQPISFASHNHHSPNNNNLKTTAVGTGYPTTGTPTSTPNQNGGRTSISPRVSIPPPSSVMNEHATLDLTSSHSNQTPTPPVVSTGLSNGVTTISDSSQSETSKDSILAVPPSNNKDDEKNSPAPTDSELKQQKSPGENTGNKDKLSAKNPISPPTPKSAPPNPENVSTTSDNIVTSTLDASGCNSPPVVVSSSTSVDVVAAAE